MKKNSVFVKMLLTFPAIVISLVRLFKFTFSPVNELWNGVPVAPPAPPPPPPEEIKHDFH